MWVSTSHPLECPLPPRLTQYLRVVNISKKKKPNDIPSATYVPLLCRIMGSTLPGCRGAEGPRGRGGGGEGRKEEGGGSGPSPGSSACRLARPRDGRPSLWGAAGRTENATHTPSSRCAVPRHWLHRRRARTRDVAGCHASALELAPHPSCLAGTSAREPLQHWGTGQTARGTSHHITAQHCTACSLLACQLPPPPPPLGPACPGSTIIQITHASGLAFVKRSLSSSQ